MTVPKLSQPSSGFGGRGYKRIFEGGVVSPSITTALGALDKPGLIDWHLSQTLSYAVTHIDELLSRSAEAGMRYLQYYSRRLKPEKVDDIDVYTYSMGVLDDLSNVGNFIHDYIESDLNGWFPEDPKREDQAEMVIAYHEWKDQHDVEVVCTERTVFGHGYAGTLDQIITVDGVTYCCDTKSSRRVYDSHIAQLGAIGAAYSMATEVPKGTPGAVYHKLVPSVAKHYGGQEDSWWVEEPLPDFDAYAILQVRPGDYSNRGEYIPPFCELKVIPHEQVEAGYDIFRAGLDARIAQKKFNEVVKSA